MLARSHHAGGSFREARVDRGTWQQPACAGQVSGWRLGCRYCRDEYSYRHPVYELDVDMKPIRHYYPGNAERVRKAMQASANHVSLKNQMEARA